MMSYIYVLGKKKKKKCSKIPPVFVVVIKAVVKHLSRVERVDVTAEITLKRMCGCDSWMVQRSSYTNVRT